MTAVPPRDSGPADDDTVTVRVNLTLELVKSPEGYWIAAHQFLMMHGTGDTIAAAVFDFLSVAGETYADLETSEYRLGYHLQAELEALRAIAAPGADEVRE